MCVSLWLNECKNAVCGTLAGTVGCIWLALNLRLSVSNLQAVACHRLRCENRQKLVGVQFALQFGHFAVELFFKVNHEIGFEFLFFGYIYFESFHCFSLLKYKDRKKINPKNKNKKN